MSSRNYVTAGSRSSRSLPRSLDHANFKESQLADMRKGQKAKITIDAYPSLDLRGHVDSIQLGSGSKFTAFPPENATGNFVKVVQRVPVKIVIDSASIPIFRCRSDLGRADGDRQMSAAEASTSQSDATWKPEYNPWLIAVSVTLAAFMEILDTTIVNVALPHIAGSLSSSSDEATWALTSYLVANGIVLTISGGLAICSAASAISSSASRCSRSARFFVAPRPVLPS